MTVHHQARRSWARGLTLGVALGLSLASCGGSTEDDRCAITLEPNGADDQLLEADAGNPAGCPSTPLAHLCSASGLVCAYRVACASQVTELQYRCDENSILRLLSTDCAHPFDYCPPLALLCSGQSWRQIGGGDDPPGCSWDPPPPGSACVNVGLAGETECGYWCDGSHQTWTIAHCAWTDPQDSAKNQWQFDGACPASC